MRVATFLMYFCFLLLGGKNYASTVIVNTTDDCCSIQTISENKQSFLSNDDQITTVFDDIDIDFDEEFHIDSASKNSNTFSSTQSLVTSLYKANLTFTLSDNCKKTAKTLPYLNGNSCPIYIVQRVLRI